MSARRLSEIDNLYVIGILLVIFGHSHSNNREMFAAGIIMPMALAYTYKRLKIPGKYIFDLITGIDSGKETA